MHLLGVVVGIMFIIISVGMGIDELVLVGAQLNMRVAMIMIVHCKMIRLIFICSG